jgi:hypothetical protein
MRRRTGLDAKLIKGICKHRNGVLLSDGLVTFGTLETTSDRTRHRETFPVWGGSPAFIELEGENILIYSTAQPPLHGS